MENVFQSGFKRAAGPIRYFNVELTRLRDHRRYVPELRSFLSLFGFRTVDDVLGSSATCRNTSNESVRTPGDFSDD